MSLSIYHLYTFCNIVLHLLVFCYLFSIYFLKNLEKIFHKFSFSPLINMIFLEIYLYFCKVFLFLFEKYIHLNNNFRLFINFYTIYYLMIVSIFIYTYKYTFDSFFYNTILFCNNLVWFASLSLFAGLFLIFNPYYKQQMIFLVSIYVFH